MYHLAYVLLPFTDQDPGEAISASLAPFKVGLRGDLPDEWLRFRDETADVREEHETRNTFALDQHGISITGGDMWLIDGDAVRAAFRFAVRRDKYRLVVSHARLLR